MTSSPSHQVDACAVDRDAEVLCRASSDMVTNASCVISTATAVISRGYHSNRFPH